MTPLVARARLTCWFSLEAHAPVREGWFDYKEVHLFGPRRRWGAHLRLWWDGSSWRTGPGGKVWVSRVDDRWRGLAAPAAATEEYTPLKPGHDGDCGKGSRARAGVESAVAASAPLKISSPVAPRSFAPFSLTLGGSPIRLG